MPCQGGMSYTEVVVESSTVIDALTQKLCFLCASLYKDDLLEKYGNPEISEWHRDHMHKDELRVAEEMKQVFLSHPGAHPVGVAQDFLDKALAVHPVSDYHKEWFYKMAHDIHKELMEIKEKKAQKAADKHKALSKLTEEEKKLLGIKEL